MVSRQIGQRSQNDGSGLTQRAHSGCVRVPPRIDATVPQRLQAAHHDWQRSHHG